MPRPFIALTPALVALLGVTLGACGMRGEAAQQYTLQPGDITPAATGSIEVEETEAANQRLTVQVKHLPPPERLHPALSHYVVWAQPRGIEEQQALNLGRLTIDQERQGTIETVTPYRNFDVMVTAEATPTPEEPSDFVVLQGYVAGASP